MDLVDWASTSESFRKLIGRECLVIWKGVKRGKVTVHENLHGAGVGIRTWISTRLGEVCTKIGSGATPRGGKNVYLRDGPYALIRSQNVHNHGFDREGLAFIGEEHASKLRNVEVHADDVLLNITGHSVARVCQVVPDVLPARVNQHVAIIRPDVAKLDPTYLRYLLVSPKIQAVLLSWAGTGGTRNALTKEMIQSFEVPSPPLPEQLAIANVLHTFDEKIELNRRMNQTLEAIARTLFKSWFVDFDPVRAKLAGRDTGLPRHLADLFPASFVDSELGAIPDGWTIFRLDELAVHHTNTVTPSSFPDTDFEHLSIPAYDSGQTPAIDRGVTIKSNKVIVPSHAVLLSKLNPTIPRVWMPDTPKQCPQICSTEFLAFTPQMLANRSLLYSLFVNSMFRTTLQSMVTGTSTSHQRIPPTALKSSNVLSGTRALFDTFDGIVGPLLTRVIKNRTESCILATQRDTLLPNLIFGRVRVLHDRTR